ncbi:hypothetical protein ACLOJK_034911, partial [Asimina triloba]
QQVVAHLLSSVHGRSLSGRQQRHFKAASRWPNSSAILDPAVQIHCQKTHSIANPEAKQNSGPRTITPTPLSSEPAAMASRSASHRTAAPVRLPNPIQRPWPHSISKRTRPICIPFATPISMDEASTKWAAPIESGISNCPMPASRQLAQSRWVDTHLAVHACNAILPPTSMPVQRRSTLEPASIRPIDRPSTTSASHPSALHQQATAMRFQIHLASTSRSQ